MDRKIQFLVSHPMRLSGSGNFPRSELNCLEDYLAELFPDLRETTFELPEN
jgi:hypothetical protein